jgi:hypothetical protein
MMSSVLRLRWLNLAGALLLVGYGLCLHAAPVVALNLFITLVNSYYLVRIYTDREYFRTLPVEDSIPYLRHFLAVHEPDLRRFFPDFDPSQLPRLEGFYVLRNAVTAGLFMGRRRADGGFEIELDYVIPRFRDFKVGRHVFVDQAAHFRAHGCERFVARSTTKAHDRYLAKMGFTRTGQEAGAALWGREIAA